jgi:hypothetical protein
MHTWRFLFALSSVFTLISCSQPRDLYRSKVSSDISQPVVSILYLSDVACSNNSSCGNDALDKLRQSCIEKGFTEKRPTSGISFSRSISEGTSATYAWVSKYEEKTDRVETVTPSGVVMIEDGPTQIRTRVNTEMIQGYCIGSEYLVAP